MKISDLTQDAAGAKVIYTAINGDQEEGEISSWNDYYIFVTYKKSGFTAATEPWQLEFSDTNAQKKLAFMSSLRRLNEAAYEAIRAGADTTALPSIDRHSMRLIASETDRLVDDGERSGESPSRIEASGA